MDDSVETKNEGISMSMPIENNPKALCLER